MDKLSNNNISLAGEFAVLSQLALRGYDANLTLGRTKCVDVLVSIPWENKMYKLEVKTTIGMNYTAAKSLFGRTLEWVMGEKNESIIAPNLYYCFVILQEDFKTAQYFIVPSKVVGPYVKQQHELWMKYHPKSKPTTMRKFRLALEVSGYRLKTPRAKRYEDNWAFKN